MKVFHLLSSLFLPILACQCMHEESAASPGSRKRLYPSDMPYFDGAFPINQGNSAAVEASRRLTPSLRSHDKDRSSRLTYPPIVPWRRQVDVPRASRSTPTPASAISPLEHHESIRGSRSTASAEPHSYTSHQTGTYTQDLTTRPYERPTSFFEPYPSKRLRFNPPPFQYQWSAVDPSVDQKGLNSRLKENRTMPSLIEYLNSLSEARSHLHYFFCQFVTKCEEFSQKFDEIRSSEEPGLTENQMEYLSELLLELTNIIRGYEGYNKAVESFIQQQALPADYGRCTDSILFLKLLLKYFQQELNFSFNPAFLSLAKLTVRCLHMGDYAAFVSRAFFAEFARLSCNLSRTGNLQMIVAKSFGEELMPSKPFVPSSESSSEASHSATSSSSPLADNGDSYTNSASPFSRSSGRNSDDTPGTYIWHQPYSGNQELSRPLSVDGSPYTSESEVFTTSSGAKFNTVTLVPAIPTSPPRNPSKRVVPPSPRPRAGSRQSKLAKHLPVNRAPPTPMHPALHASAVPTLPLSVPVHLGHDVHPSRHHEKMPFPRQTLSEPVPRRVASSEYASWKPFSNPQLSANVMDYESPYPQPRSRLHLPSLDSFAPALVESSVPSLGHSAPNFSSVSMDQLLDRFQEHGNRL